MKCLSDINQKDERKTVTNCPSDGLIDNVLIFQFELSSFTASTCVARACDLNDYNYNMVSLVLLPMVL